VQFKNGGEYDFSDEKLQDTVGIKPQNWRTKRTQFWELQKGQNSKAGTALDKILFRVWYLCWNLTKNGHRLREDHRHGDARYLEHSA
jgi:hypothetical protein